MTSPCWRCAGRTTSRIARTRSQATAQGAATHSCRRLVRDAEYEYAARGGLDGARLPWGDAEPAGYAHFGNSDGAPLPVASFAVNGFGLHDMAGSMWCWCEERFDEVVAFDRDVTAPCCALPARQNSAG